MRLLICQETVNTGISHFLQLLGGQEGFLMVIKQTILTRTVPKIYLRDTSQKIKVVTITVVTATVCGVGCLRHVPGVPFGEDAFRTSTDVE